MLLTHLGVSTFGLRNLIIIVSGKRESSAVASREAANSLTATELKTKAFLRPPYHDRPVFLGVVAR